MIDFCNGHADDAGVTCQMRKLIALTTFCWMNFTPCCVVAACESGSIRLVGGMVPWEGRVEVCRDRTWGTVCDDFWSTEDATVACRWAGFSPISQFITKLSLILFIIVIVVCPSVCLSGL